MSVQYTGERFTVQRGIFSTPGDIMSTAGDIMSTLVVFSTLGDIMSTLGEYHDKSGGRLLGK